MPVAFVQPTEDVALSSLEELRGAGGAGARHGERATSLYASTDAGSAWSRELPAHATGKIQNVESCAKVTSPSSTKSVCNVDFGEVNTGRS